MSSSGHRQISVASFCKTSNNSNSEPRQRKTEGIGVRNEKRKKEKHLCIGEPKSGRQNTSVNAAQLSHIKKSVLGPEAFDRLISARIPEGPGCCSCSHSAAGFLETEGGKLRPENNSRVSATITCLYFCLFVCFG